MAHVKLIDYVSIEIKKEITLTYILCEINLFITKQKIIKFLLPNITVIEETINILT